MSWRYITRSNYTIKKPQTLGTCFFHHFTSTSIVCLNMIDKPPHLFPQNDTKVILTPQIVQSIIRSCHSDLIALSTFIWCAKQHNYFHDNQTFDHMVDVVARLTRHCKTVKTIVKELECAGLIIKAQIFLLLLRIYWRGGMYSMVFETFEEMGLFGYEPNTFARNIVLDVLFKIGHVEAAVSFLKETPFPNFLSFNITLCQLSKLNNLVHTKDVLQIMLKKGYHPNPETFKLILNSYCKMRRLKEAYQLLGLMMTLGITLSVEIWTILIDGFCRLHQPVMASYLLDKMVKCGYSPNVVTYTTMIKGFMTSGMIFSAFNTVDIMVCKGCAPDLVLCNVLIDTLSKIGRYDDALYIFQLLSKWKLVPDSYTFSSLVSTLCHDGKFDMLPKLCSGADLVFYNALMDYYCKVGLPGLAVELYDRIVDKSFTPDNYSFVGLLIGLCGSGQVNEAVNVYRGLVKFQTNLDAHVHTAIVAGLIKNGDCFRAIKIFKEAIVNKYPLDAVSYTIAICGLIKCGRSVEACAYYVEMKDAGLAPNAHTCNILLNGFCATRDTENINMMLDEIIEARIWLNRKTFIHLTKSLLRHELSPSICYKLTILRKMGLLPGDAKHMSSSDRRHRNVNVSGVNHQSPTMVLEENLFEDSSSSDDILDMVAAVG